MADNAKCSKMGRLKKKCERYAAAKTKWKNKVRRIKQHLKGHPKNQTALDALVRIRKEHGVS